MTPKVGWTVVLKRPVRAWLGDWDSTPWTNRYAHVEPGYSSTIKEIRSGNFYAPGLGKWSLSNFDFFDFYPPPSLLDKEYEDLFI